MSIVKRMAGTAIVLMAGLYAVSCDSPKESTSTTPATAEKADTAEQVVAAEKAFTTGGSIDLQLDGGSYDIRPADEDRIRVMVNGQMRGAAVDLAVTDRHASVTVKDTPHNDFQATIEVPKTADLVVHLKGGNLTIGAIAGNKDIESVAGNTEIAVGDPRDYASVDATVKAGDIDAGPFGESKSGLFQHLTWSGPGTHTLRANLGAGNLALRSK